MLAEPPGKTGATQEATMATATLLDAKCDDRTHTRSQTDSVVIDGQRYRLVYCDGGCGWVNARPVYAQERRGR